MLLMLPTLKPEVLVKDALPLSASMPMLPPITLSAVGLCCRSR